jgi:membrane protease YdiL (CAAX protease family)
VDDTNLAAPVVPVPPVVAPEAAPIAGLQLKPLPRWVAILEALAVSGIPTQIVVFAALAVASSLNLVGMRVLDDGGHISLEFMATGLLLDTALIALMIRIFLGLNGENSRDVFVGTRPVFGEILRGLLFMPLVLIGVTAVAFALRLIAPSLHNVEENPLAQYMKTPLEAGIFIVVVILGAGIKEELQRAFILRRFEQSLGGIKLGLAITSIIFGLLHVTQGIDVSIAIGLLGLFWGVLYAKRRSAVMGMTNHAAFDSAQILQYVLIKSLGG